VDLTGRLSNPELPGQSVEAPGDTTANGNSATASIHAANQRQTRLKQSEIEDLLQERASGASITDLASRFGIHHTTVMAHLHRTAPPQT